MATRLRVMTNKRMHTGGARIPDQPSKRPWERELLSTPLEIRVRGYGACGGRTKANYTTQLKVVCQISNDTLPTPQEFTESFFIRRYP